jgi:hypothetical protein
MVRKAINERMHRKIVLISTVLVKILSIKAQKGLKILIGNFTALKKLKEAKRESKGCFLQLS